MSEGPQTNPSSTPPQRKTVGRPFAKGQSGNPGGRPPIEPRVRRYARKYDRRMCRALAEIAIDPKVPASERRRAAMDLIAVGSGRPALVQEIAGRNGAPVGPLVAFNFNNQPGQSLPPDVAYQMMCQGQVPIDPEYFRPAIEVQPTVQGTETSP
jgi:hypothetical protein